MKEIKLTRGKFALVDDADFNRVNKINWCACKYGRRFYAVRTDRTPEGSVTTLMHNYILGEKGIDHRDGDGLNNQKHNLRRATQSQNLQGFQRKHLNSTSSYRGVSWHGIGKKWQAHIKIPLGKRTYLGLFASEIEAAKAYDAAARRFFGEFAAPNFPTENNKQKKEQKHGSIIHSH